MSENNFLTGVHYGLSSIRDQALRNCIGNRNLINATITLEAGDKNDIESQGVALSYTIDGKLYAKAAIADLNVTVADAYNNEFVQQAGEKCYYVLCLDTAGAVTSYKGGNNQWPVAHPANLCPFCVIEVDTVGVTFTQGTDDYDASGVTSTFHNVAVVPANAP